MMQKYNNLKLEVDAQHKQELQRLEKDFSNLRKEMPTKRSTYDSTMSRTPSSRYSTLKNKENSRPRLF